MLAPKDVEGAQDIGGNTGVNYQYQFKFMLYADFESILKPVDERYRMKMIKIKTERKVKTPYTEKINSRIPSGCCVHSTFTFGDVFGPLKMYRVEGRMEKFIEHIEDEVKRL